MPAFRYLALLWHPGDFPESSASRSWPHELCARLQHWQRGVYRDGLAIFYMGEPEGTNTCHVLATDAGAVLGTVFRRNAVEPAANGLTPPSPPFKCDPLDAERILATGGRWLLESCWGRYVAVFRDSRDATYKIIRDPSGTLPALTTTSAGVTVFFCLPDDAITLGVLQPSINWRYIATHTVFPQLNGHETALAGVSEVSAGECLSISTATGHRARTFLWHPAKFAQMPLEDEENSLPRQVYSTTKHCVHSWTTGHRSVLHRLSGGLDSSVVLCCLRDAPGHPKTTALNYFTQSPLGDERQYARAAAARAACPLIERPIQARTDLRRLLTLRPGARPGFYLASLQFSDMECSLARDLDATALFGGGWGDQLFYRTRNHLPAMDYIASHGLTGRWLSVLRDMAQLTRTTVWTVLRHLLTDTFSPKRHASPLPAPPPDALTTTEVDRVFRDPDYALHPWLQGSTDVPPGKLRHILLLSGPIDLYRSFATPEDPESIEPLRSQPLMELCLQIPTYTLTQGAGDRLIERIAFREELPELVARRLSKGFGDEGFHAVLHHNLPFVRELLLDGLLVREKILDRQKLEHSLCDDVLRTSKPRSDLFAYICTESWLKRWQLA